MRNLDYFVSDLTHMYVECLIRNFKEKSKKKLVTFHYSYFNHYLLTSSL